MEPVSLVIPFLLAFLIALFMGALFLISRISDLPLPHFRLASTQGSPRALAIVLSGSGGWIRFDQRLAEALSAAQMDVLGIDSLRYFFWKKKSPALLASDIANMIRQWQEKQSEAKDLILIGYSKGADVLPFAVNLLEPDLRDKVKLVALLGVARLAAFRMSLGDLMTGGRKGLFPLQVSPEIKKLDPLPGLCIYGHQDRVSLCRNLKRVSSMEVHEIQGGSVFYEVEPILNLILQKYEKQIQEPETEILEPQRAPSRPPLRELHP